MSRETNLDILESLRDLLEAGPIDERRRTELIKWLYKRIAHERREQKKEEQDDGTS